LDRGSAAVPIIDECLRRTGGNSEHAQLVLAMMDLRLRHFEKIKDGAGCRTTAEMWENLNRKDATSFYNAACMRAVTAAVASGARVAKGPPVAGTDAEDAMGWLRRALAAGYSDISQVLTDPDLASVRNRPDYAALLWDVADLPPTAKGAAP
jgi:hypothetical protein